MSLSLVARSRILSLHELGGYLTIADAATAKGVSYHAMVMWLRYNRDVPTSRVGTRILVKLSDLSTYRPHAVR